MSKNLLPKITLWGLSLVSIVAVLMMFLGGSIDPTVEHPEPVYTDELLYWIGIMIALAVIITLGFGIAQFVKKIASKPKEMLRSLIGIILLVAVFVITFLTGDDSPIEIIGYDGHQNQGTWLLIVNMFISTIGILIAVAVLLMIFAKAFKPKVKDAKKK